jgi:hypothetical protein
MSAVQTFVAITVLFCTAGSLFLLYAHEYVQKLKERDMWQARAKALEAIVLRNEANPVNLDQAKRGRLERLFSQASD